MSIIDRFVPLRGTNLSDKIDLFQYITDIWDEIKESEELESISEEEKKLLLTRLAKYKANHESAMDWSDLKKEL